MPKTTAAAGPEEGFGRALAAALGQVNDLQTRSMDMAQAMITDPDSVDIHDVTIALAEANLSLSMTKAIMDRAIRAYQEIINVR
ncbi:MAG: flagellar hook-basal body complex protein FliE [Spirochaetales bacterium]|nr:flagellar hook-basal body complex protein FliE [Spirochaetales bacterium]